MSPTNKTDPTILPTAVTVDCADAVRLATFWSTVAGGTVADAATADFATLDRPGSITINFVSVPEFKTAKNRMHLDISVADLTASTAVAERAGATTVQRHDGWTTLRDPEGNEFCLVAG